MSRLMTSHPARLALLSGHVKDFCPAGQLAARILKKIMSLQKSSVVVSSSTTAKPRNGNFESQSSGLTKTQSSRFVSPDSSISVQIH